MFFLFIHLFKQNFRVLKGRQFEINTHSMHSMDKSNYKRVSNDDDGLGLAENLLMNILLCIRTFVIKGKISKCKCFEPLDGKGNVLKKMKPCFIIEKIV